MASAGQHVSLTVSGGSGLRSDDVVVQHIRVLVNAPSPPVRSKLEKLLRDDGRFVLLSRGIVPGSSHSGDADVILAAISGRDDIKAIDDLPGAPLVVLADDLSRKQLLHALGSRLFGILPQSAAGTQICAALEAAAAGLVTMTADDCEWVSFNTALPEPEEDGDLLEALTPREAEVLALMARGLGNRKIAERLDISEHTAKFHVSSILGKLGASSRTEAVAKGLKQGLLLV